MNRSQISSLTIALLSFLVTVVIVFLADTASQYADGLYIVADITCLFGILWLIRFFTERKRR